MFAVGMFKFFYLKEPRLTIQLYRAFILTIYICISKNEGKDFLYTDWFYVYCKALQKFE